MNYWVDVAIGVSFASSAISGLVFLLPVGSSRSGVLGVSYLAWNQLHTWSSVALIAGVLAHLVLHWKWIVGMTRKMLPFGKRAVKGLPSAPGPTVSRRRFLVLGSAAAVTGMIAIGGWWITSAWPSDAEQGNLMLDSGSAGATGEGDSPTDEPEQPVQQQGGVACPRGVVNDPYPGQCRRYTDRNGDGICDYSVPGSGYN